MTKQVKHNKKAYDYIISAENGEVVVTKYLEEKVWNQDFNEYFTKTEVVGKTSNPTLLSNIIEWMNDHAIVDTIYTSSSMDYSKEYGFTEDNTARDIWDRAWDIYKTREFHANFGGQA